MTPRFPIFQCSFFPSSVVRSMANSTYMPDSVRCCEILRVSRLRGLINGDDGTQRVPNSESGAETVLKGAKSLCQVAHDAPGHIDAPLAHLVDNAVPASVKVLLECRHCGGTDGQLGREEEVSRFHIALPLEEIVHQAAVRGDTAIEIPGGGMPPDHDGSIDKGDGVHSDACSARGGCDAPDQFLRAPERHRAVRNFRISAEEAHAVVPPTAVPLAGPFDGVTAEHVYDHGGTCPVLPDGSEYPA